MNSIKRRLAISLIIASLSLTYYKYDYEYNPDYEILDDSELAYGRYSNGLVYIGDSSYLCDLSYINSNDIIINDNNEEITIYSSYKITDKEQRNEIINILKNYEVKNSTYNNRSIESMRMEWFIHNLLYNCHIKRERTKNVDFENNEEKYYNKKILSKIFKI